MTGFVSVADPTLDLAERWLQVMAGISADENPLLDETGEFAYLGDIGDVHYLAGNFGGETTREFNVDAGDTLFLPMINAFTDPREPVGETGDDVLALFDLEPVKASFEIFLRVDLDNDGSYEFDMTFDVSDGTYLPYDPDSFTADPEAQRFFVVPDSGDGVPVEFPKNSIWDAAEIVEPSPYPGYIGGYFAAIEGLPEGTHKIEFGGILADGGFSVAITDIITVIEGETLFGTLRRDVLEGGEGDDKLFGFGGRDKLFGNGGDDCIWGGFGRDKIDGGAGRDAIFGGFGRDKIIGGAGDDQLSGGLGRDCFIFNDSFGDDVITDWSRRDKLKIEDATAEDVAISVVAEGVLLEVSSAECEGTVMLEEVTHFDVDAIWFA